MTGDNSGVAGILTPRTQNRRNQQEAEMTAFNALLGLSSNSLPGTLPDLNSTAQMAAYNALLMPLGSNGANMMSLSQQLLNSKEQLSSLSNTNLRAVNIFNNQTGFKRKPSQQNCHPLKKRNISFQKTKPTGTDIENQPLENLAQAMHQAKVLQQISNQQSLELNSKILANSMPNYQNMGLLAPRVLTSQNVSTKVEKSTKAMKKILKQAAIAPKTSQSSLEKPHCFSVISTRKRCNKCRTCNQKPCGTCANCLHKKKRKRSCESRLPCIEQLLIFAKSIFTKEENDVVLRALTSGFKASKASSANIESGSNPVSIIQKRQLELKSRRKALQAQDKALETLKRVFISRNPSTGSE
mmetsp:Transcript_16515/g.18671  ORF Transcript_16515/g.18671 Transcript_16515/m.18671 type:complete len:355 (+) Transcript_16515:47-1111(+)